MRTILSSNPPLTIYTHSDSSLGQLLLASREGKLSGLYFADQPHARIAPGWVRQDDADIFAQTVQQLDEYASGGRESFELPVSLSGTPFQMFVWLEIAKIPFGQTITYGELAERIGRTPRDARAVGMATGQNPVSWIVPCHRVVGKSGAFTGYAGGFARKNALLEFEGAKSVGWEAILAHGDKQSALALV
jgi:methylated-DNA-[protein]-cysteine S-methyltransferase